MEASPDGGVNLENYSALVKRFPSFDLEARSNLRGEN